MSRPKQRKGGRVTPKGTGAASRPTPGGPAASVPLGTYNDAPLAAEWTDAAGAGVVADGIPGVIAVAADAIASGHPAELLVLTSSLAEASAEDERAVSTDDDADDVEAFTWSSVIEELSGSVRPETTALLYALRPLAPEEWGSKIAAELARRSTPGLPEWISGIGDAEVKGVWVRHEEPEPDDDVFAVVRWPTGQVMTFIANVARQPEPVVQDALLAPVDVSALAEAGGIPSAGPMELIEVDLADARAMLDAAVGRWESTSPEEASEDWPSTRPLLRWLLSTLPEGGDERWPDADA